MRRTPFGAPSGAKMAGKARQMAFYVFRCAAVGYESARDESPPMKRALVTGGSGAIGGAICRELAAQGLHVVVHAHPHAAAAPTPVGEMRGQGGSARIAGIDVF